MSNLRQVYDSQRNPDQAAMLPFLYNQHAQKPTDYIVLKELADSELAAANHEQALTIGRTAAASHSADGESLFVHGKALAANGYHYRALSRYLQAEQRLPYNEVISGLAANLAHKMQVWGDHLYFESRLHELQLKNNFVPSLLGVGAVSLALDALKKRPRNHEVSYFLLAWPELRSVFEHHVITESRRNWDTLHQAFCWAFNEDPDLQPYARKRTKETLQYLNQPGDYRQPVAILKAWVAQDEAAWDLARKEPISYQSNINQI